MKNIIIFILFIIQTSFSQSGWFWQNPLPQGNDLLAVVCPSPNLFYAAGTSGTILKSTNQGSNWLLLNQELETEYQSLFFLNEFTGYAGGGKNETGLSYGKVMKTSNGGELFYNILIDSNCQIKDIYFIDLNTGFVIASNLDSYLYKTSNGGISWMKILIGNNITVRSCCFLNSLTGFSSVEQGSNCTILMTTNGGISWNSKFSSTG